MTYSGEAMFSGGSIAAMLAAGIICLAVPIAALVIYKRKNKDVPVSAFFIGCGTFFLFALVLEQLLHTVMLPIVSGSILLYTVYGALAAGIFEETGRFIAFKTLLKKHTSPSTAIMYGLGHGGIEAIALVSLNMISYAFIGAAVNSMGLDAFVNLSSAGDSYTASMLRDQLTAIAAAPISSYVLSVLERVIAMTFHTAISVMVFESARIRKRIWLYPVCILIHALLDAPAALYQRGIISLAVVYPMMIIYTGIVVFAAIRSFRRIKTDDDKI